MLTHKETERQRDRETERQRDKETKRQRDKETKRQRDRETERQRDRETERQRDRERDTERKTGQGERETLIKENLVLLLIIVEGLVAGDAAGPLVTLHARHWD